MSLVELALKKMQAKARSIEPARPRAPVAPEPSATAIRAAAAAPASIPRMLGELTSTESKELPPGTVPRHRTDKLVRIDRHALRAQGLMPPEHQERALADQYRQIKRPLIAHATGRSTEKLPKGQLIMMASAMPGEGKTFTSINLALSMAMEKDISVLLIDADVAKPHISRTFGLGDEPGLLDILRDEKLTIESVILPTDVDNLCILPAGRSSDTATELLASHRMEEIVSHLAATDPMRVALIDSSPLLLTSESHALTRSVGQVVMVVRAGFTPHQAVLNALEHIVEGVSIGLILNQSTAPTGGYYYGYGDLQGTPPA